MIRFSWLLTRSLRVLISFKISSSLASDFCWRHKRPVRNKHLATVTVKLSYVTSCLKDALYSLGHAYARLQGLVLWGLTRFAHTGAQWVVITEQNCRDAHGAGPRRAAMLWVRCGRTPSNRRPEQQQTPQFVGQRVGWTTSTNHLMKTASNLPHFKHIQFVCLTLGSPERQSL